MYENYDEQDHQLGFDPYVRINLWDTIKFDNESPIVNKEIVHF